MPSVGVYYHLGRGLWLVGSILFIVAGIFQIVYFMKNITAKEKIKLFLPFLFFGYAFIALGISSYLISTHAGLFLEFSNLSMFIYTLFSISGLLVGLSGFLIMGRGIKEVAGTYLIIIGSYLYFYLANIYTAIQLPIKLPIDIYFLTLIILLILIGLSASILFYTYFAVRRFAPFAYAISLIFIILLFLTYSFERMLPTVLGFTINYEFLRWILLTFSASLATSGSIFGREKSKIAAVSYTFAIVYIMLIFAGYLSLAPLLSIIAQIRLLDWTITGMLAFFSAGYLSGRYTERRDTPTLFFSIYFYGIGFTALMVIGQEIGWLFLPMLSPIFFVSLFYITLLISATALFLSSMAIVGRERVTTVTLMILSAVSTYLYLNPEIFYMSIQFSLPLYNVVVPFSEIFTLILAGFLFIPLFLFALLLMALARESLSVVHIRTISLLLGTFLYIISLVGPYFWPYQSPFEYPTFILIAQVAMLPTILRLLSMSIYVLGITGLLARLLKIGRRKT